MGLAENYRSVLRTMAEEESDALKASALRWLLDDHQALDALRNEIADKGLAPATERLF
jgi:hypothetical protein